MTRHALPAAAFILALASLPVMAEKSIEKATGTFKSVTVTRPAGDEQFPAAPYADLVNKNCLSCHSADMVLNQPALPDGAWLAEIDNMQTVYKAQIAPEEVEAIVAYLTGLQGVNRPRWR